MQKSSSFSNNCLNLIRLIAAIKILFGHTVTHLKIGSIPNPVFSVMNVILGVPIFFFLSGYLIWNSIGRTKGFKTFLTKRVLRLYPELWCGVAISAITILIFYGNRIELLPFAVFLFCQSTVFQFWTPGFLKDFGCGVPNGSLWTIGVMVQAYIVIWLVYKLLHKKSVVRWIVLFVTSAAINIVYNYLGAFVPTVAVKLLKMTFIPHLWLFLLGAFMCEHFEIVIDLLKKWWYIPFAISILVGFIPEIGIYPVLRSSLFCVSVLGFAYKFPRLKLKVDLSYGIYIYHMVVVNVLIELGLVGSIWYQLLVLVVSASLALLSYVSFGRIYRSYKQVKG